MLVKKASITDRIFIGIRARFLQVYANSEVIKEINTFVYKSIKNTMSSPEPNKNSQRTP